LLVSGGNALLSTALFWGHVAGRLGARATIAGVFAGMSAMLVGAAFAGEAAPFLAAAFLLGCAFFAVALDALGSMTFMRAVHAFERPQMAGVYRTYLDLSELIPPLVYAVVLAYWGLGAVFASLSVFTLACGAVAWRHLPRSL
jgi:predicted MFS family arabinose efflux permease